MKRTKTSNLVMTAVFAAIVMLMAFVPFLGFIPLGVVDLTIIHIPVIIGSIVLGPKCGAALGTIFGLTSLINGTIRPVLTSFLFSPFAPKVMGIGGDFRSLIICFIPRILVGIVPYFVFKGLMKLSKKQVLSLGAAGLIGSLTNTLLVMNLVYVLYGEEYAVVVGKAYDVLYGAILAIIAGNGIPEAIGAAVLTAGIGKILLLVMKESR